MFLLYNYSFPKTHTRANLFNLLVKSYASLVELDQGWILELCICGPGDNKVFQQTKLMLRTKLSSYFMRNS